MTEFTKIPILDVGAIYDGDAGAKRELAEQFAQTYGTTGFGYISNHGIDQSLIDRVFNASARFHALPRDKKMAIELDELHRGFIPINTSTDVNSKLADVKKPNQSESFMMMREDEPNSPDVQQGAYLAGPNQWPDLAGFREDVVAYNDAMSQLGSKLMEIAALSIGVDPQELLSEFARPTTWLRLLYYAPTEPQKDTDLFGSAPHMDFGCLTILAQDKVGGLQVMTPAGDWVDAPFIPGTFVLNVGDMLHRWSNGRLLSTPHRVINHSGKSRYSVPFFYDPNVATVIEPLPSCMSASEPSQFEPINFGEFLKSELETSYEKHKV